MEFITVAFDKTIDRTSFDCSTHPALNTYIAQQAGQDEKRNVSRTFMYLEDGMLLGYYTLANTSVALDELSEEQARKMPRYPMPAAMLSRLAVDQRMQRKGLGQRLMADFFRRIYTVSMHSGVAFIVVDAKDEQAAKYYQELMFIPSKHNPLRLLLSTATIIQGLRPQEQLKN
ncbi:GNAT family N-acetyltransferase [Pseudomonas kermanshahensis]|uniref:GNAT family N-acetyltransferase n=1 Tax=Pseudomonas kermanshahensis TaxID=2745482 RepID=A0ABU8R2S3_9PSED|nr:GNAT family N-acetyltransferase [Pseudomonas sp. SWRI50]MBC3484267.1 GNAT family N-acetyltransferase [Pseudomonas sp. SWRI50]